MNLISLSDTKLAAVHRQVTNEMERRARIVTTGHDAAAIIFGNEMAKRTVVIAAAGNHSLLLVGPSNCGKTMMRAVALELGLSQTFEARPCPCGHRNNPYHACSCTARQIERHVRTFPQADITVEMVLPAERERRTPGTGLAYMRRQIEDKTDFLSATLDEVSRTLLSTAVRDVGLDPDQQRRAIAVARTIANLDRQEQIGVTHLMESINYRGLRF
jgi:predicted ATPase with chaperone activity